VPQFWSSSARRSLPPAAVVDRRARPHSPTGTLTGGAGKNWPTVGGDVANTRFSSLTQIAPGNVSKLHLVWQGTYGAPITPAGFNSGAAIEVEGAPLVFGGVMYLATPAGRRRLDRSDERQAELALEVQCQARRQSQPPSMRRSAASLWAAETSMSRRARARWSRSMQRAGNCAGSNRSQSRARVSRALPFPSTTTASSTWAFPARRKRAATSTRSTQPRASGCGEPSSSAPPP